MPSSPQPPSADVKKVRLVVMAAMDNYALAHDDYDAAHAALDALVAERDQLRRFAEEMSGLITDLGNVPDPGLDDLTGMVRVIRQAALGAKAWEETGR